MKHLLLTTIAAVLLVGVGLRDSKKFKWTLAFFKKANSKRKRHPAIRNASNNLKIKLSVISQ